MILEARDVCIPPFRGGTAAFDANQGRADGSARPMATIHIDKNLSAASEINQASPRYGSEVPSAGLGGRNVAGSDLVLVGGEGCKHFRLFALRNLEVIQGPSELRCDLIEFCR